MYNFPHDPGPGYPHGAPAPHRPGLLRMVLAAVLIGIVASMLFGSALGLFGVLFHLIGFALRVAILVAVGSFIWRRLVGGRSRRSPI